MTTTGAGPRDANTAFARAVVDEWARAGIREAVLAPGSRSAPLALALAGDDRIQVRVVIDERSAAFFALGIAKATGRAVVVGCTSGTGAANLHPAVLEAHHARVPLVVCTADRPPELRETGAGQTIDQIHLYGSAVQWYCDPGPPADIPDAGSTWRSIAARAAAAALGPPAGPVHLNLPFREPLVPTGAELVDAPGRAGGAPWTSVARPSRTPDAGTVAALAQRVRAMPRGALVAGWGTSLTPATAARFAARAGWPVLADPLSGLRNGPNAISAYDALLRVERFATTHRPNLVVRVGAAPTSKSTVGWLDPAVAQVLVDPDRTWLDPRRAVSELLPFDDETLLAAVADELEEPRDAEWLSDWREADARARAALDDLLDAREEPFEGRVARDLVAAMPAGGTLVVGSSMPVRDVESFAAPRSGVRILANRGVNGIDGFSSTVLGIASATTGPVAALLGDLCFLHDTNGLLAAAGEGLDATLVVVDNDGGGIFSFLPQAEHREHFEALFGTPHGLDLTAVAAAHGVAAVEVEKASALEPALTASLTAGGVRVVLVRTDRADNVDRHREAWAAVATSIA
jgi:2-succinyl-5-enolpyruvyl-6-hydroxy-3-cyclohexene-1-carboxylate synthase